MNYFDTSALIKRFVEEAGSTQVQQIILQDDKIATAKIAYAEVYSGFARKLREKNLSQIQFNRLCKQFDQDWLAYLQVELTNQILTLSAELIKKHPLRSFDAIHLASALFLKEELGEEIRFVVADEKLLQAAQAEGFVAEYIKGQYNL